MGSELASLEAAATVASEATKVDPELSASRGPSAEAARAAVEAAEAVAGAAAGTSSGGAERPTAMSAARTTLLSSAVPCRSTNPFRAGAAWDLSWSVFCEGREGGSGAAN